MTARGFSLLVPCHNAANFLPRLWTTVRAQTQAFDEWICYDDASTDNTPDVARDLGAKVIRGETNRGPAHARNELWKAAAGDWVHFHDADDLLDPAFLARMSARADDSNDVVICNAVWKREDTMEREMEWNYVDAELQADPASYLLRHPVGGINGLYRRTALEAVGGFNEELKVWEDADLHVRLAVNGARFSVVEEALVTAMRRGDSLSAEMRRNWRNRLRALQHYARTLPPSCVPALIAETESAARALVQLGESAPAREAIALAQQLGGDPPSTGNMLVQVCKRTFGAMAALRLQSLVRRNS